MRKLNVSSNQIVSFFVILLFFLSFFLRIYNIYDFIAYHQDQVRDLLFIKHHFDTREFILLGPKASVGNFYLPPFWYYLMSLSFLISPSPLSPAIMVALFSSLTAVVIYIFAKEFFDDRVALFASLLYAVSPLSIEYSRFAWNPNPIPFFTALTLYLLFRFKKTKNVFFFYLSVVTANFTFQLHYQGFILVLACVIFVFLYPLSKIKQYVISALLFILLLLPFFIYESTHHFTNILNIIAFFTQTTHSKFLGFNNSIRIFLFDFPRFIGRSIGFSNLYMGYILFAVLHGYILLNIKNILLKHKENRNLLFILYGVSLLVLFLYRQWIVDYYLILLLVPLILSFVLVITSLLPKNLATVVMGIILLGNIVVSPAFWKPKPTLSFFSNITQFIEQKNISPTCITTDIKDPDLQFAKNAIEYLYAIDRTNNNTTCQQRYEICGQKLCDRIKSKPLFKSDTLQLQFKAL